MPVVKMDFPLSAGNEDGAGDETGEGRAKVSHDKV